MPRHSFAEHLPKVRSQRQIAPLIKLRLIKPRPTPVDLATFYGTTQDEHHISVAMISAAVAVLPCRAPEFRHGHNHRVLPEIAEISPERSQRLREVAQHIGD